MAQTLFPVHQKLLNWSSITKISKSSFKNENTVFLTSFWYHFDASCKIKNILTWMIRILGERKFLSVGIKKWEDMRLKMWYECLLKQIILGLTTPCLSWDKLVCSGFSVYLSLLNRIYFPWSSTYFFHEYQKFIS